MSEGPVVRDSAHVTAETFVIQIHFPPGLANSELPIRRHDPPSRCGTRGAAVSSGSLCVLAAAVCFSKRNVSRSSVALMARDKFCAKIEGVSCWDGPSFIQTITYNVDIKGAMSII